jgi:hypothetical protein
MDKFQKPRSLFFPLLLVAIGIFLLLSNLGSLQNTAWENMITYWPLLLIIGGLDGLYRRDGWVGPLVVIGLGTILLLGNLHYLQWGSLDLLLRFWPVLLVAWGLDIAFGHNGSLWSTLVRVALGLALVAGIVWLSIASPFSDALKKVNFNQSLDGATQSKVTFSVAAGQLTFSGGADNNTLVSGSIGLPKEETIAPEYVSPKDGSSQYSIEGAGVVVFPLGSSIPWNLKLNSIIPIDFTSRLGVGNMVVDLSDVKVSDFQTSMGVGRTVVTVPTTGNVTGKAQVAVGELVVRVPKGKDVILHTSTGVTSIQLPKGYTNSAGVIRSGMSGDESINLNIGVAVGSLVVQEIQ